MRPLILYALPAILSLAACGDDGVTRAAADAPFLQGSYYLVWEGGPSSRQGQPSFVVHFPEERQALDSCTVRTHPQDEETRGRCSVRGSDLIIGFYNSTVFDTGLIFRFKLSRSRILQGTARMESLVAEDVGMGLAYLRPVGVDRASPGSPVDVSNRGDRPSLTGL